MPSGLHRTYDAHHLHFITCSCYRRSPFLRPVRNRDRFLSILEQTRERYRFVVVGYVVMPEHIHLLITEPEVGNPSTVMQVLKQRTARALLPKKKRLNPRQRFLFGSDLPRTPFWQARFYNFNVWTSKKRVEKLRYVHRNPVSADWPACPRTGAGAATVSTSWTKPGRYEQRRLGEDFVFRFSGVIEYLVQAFVVPALRKARRTGHPTVLAMPARSKAGPPLYNRVGVVKRHVFLRRDFGF